MSCLERSTSGRLVRQIGYCDFLIMHLQILLLQAEGANSAVSDRLNEQLTSTQDRLVDLQAEQDLVLSGTALPSGFHAGTGS